MKRDIIFFQTARANAHGSSAIKPAVRFAPKSGLVGTLGQKFHRGEVWFVEASGAPQSRVSS